MVSDPTLKLELLETIAVGSVACLTTNTWFYDPLKGVIVSFYVTNSGCCWSKVLAGTAVLKSGTHWGGELSSYRGIACLVGSGW